MKYGLKKDHVVVRRSKAGWSEDRAALAIVQQVNPPKDSKKSSRFAMTVGDIVVVDLGESVELPDGSCLVHRRDIHAIIEGAETADEERQLQEFKKLSRE